MDATPENLLTTKIAFWKRRESNVSGNTVIKLKELQNVICTSKDIHTTISIIPNKQTNKDTSSGSGDIPFQSA